MTTMRRVIEPIGMMALLLLRRGIILAPTSSTVAGKIIPNRSSSSSSTTTTQKSKQAVIIKRLRKENKDIFGDLLETKYDKIKREKKMGKNSTKNNNNNNTENNNIEEQMNEHSNENISNPIKHENNKISNIKSKMEDRNLGVQNEINWSLKNLPERSKVFNRSNPNNTIRSFEKVKLSSGQYKVFKKDELLRSPSTTHMSIKEIQKLPTIKQVYDSFQESLDIMPSFQVKLIKKNSNQTTNKNEEEQQQSINSEHFSPELVIDNNNAAAVSKFVYPNNDVKNEDRDSNNNIISDVINGNNEKILNNSHNNEKVDKSSSSFFLSSQDHHFPIDTFPYDNPEKNTGSSKKNEIQKDEIITFPFPRPSFEKNSHGSIDTMSEPHPRIPIPSVSKILNTTMSPEQVNILKKWEEKMIGKLGESGFLRYKEDLFGNGKKIHSNIQSYLSGMPKDEMFIDDSISGHWNSLQNILPKIQNVRVLESHVFHPKLNYCGIVDCVAMFRDKLVVIDWKTSEKPKPMISMTYDTPLQIAAYIGALNYDPNYSLKIHAGLVVIAYQDGKDCQTYFLNSSQIDNYWKKWLQRLKLYQSQQSTTNQE